MPVRESMRAFAWVVGILAVTSVAQAEASCAVPAEAVQMAGVPDGRSLALADGRVIRLAGIEPIALLFDESSAIEAEVRERIVAIVAGATITIGPASTDADRYGRVPALVAADGKLLQETLAREGLVVAFASGDALPCFDRIFAAENDARRSGTGSWAGRSLPWARADALAARVGAFAVFEGVVASVGNRRARTYLNFGRWWTEDVTVEVEAAHCESFGGEEALAQLAGARVRVRGYVEERGGPMIAVRSPMQIELIRAAVGTSMETP